MRAAKIVARHPPVTDPDAVSGRILKAAIALFTERSYHGASVRDLARLVRVEAASIYYHFPSKQDILLGIFERTMDDLLSGLQQALNGATGYEERLRAAVRFHVLFHVERQNEAFISHSELRSLTAANRKRINATRDRYEALLRQFLADGVRDGAFEVRDLKLATIAVLMMCSGVSDWFAAHGRLSPENIVDAYSEMVLRLLRPLTDPRSAPPGREANRRSVSRQRAARRSARKNEAHA